MARPSPYPYVPVGELLFVFAGVLFVVGSLFFVKGPVHHVRFGDSLYLIGTFIFFGKSLHSLFGQVSEHGGTLFQERHLLAECMENVFYNVSAVVFIIGCVLYWPGLFQSHEMQLKAEIYAVAFFIFGSLGFVIASYCNAVLLSRGRMFKSIPKHGQLVYNLAFIALLCAQIGGVLFVSGSFMFRPGFRNHCNRDVREGWEDLAGMLDRNFTALLWKMARDLNTTEEQLRRFMPHKEVCEDIIDTGVFLFLAGSCFYLIQSILYLIMAYIKHYAYNEELDEEYEYTDDDSDNFAYYDGDATPNSRTSSLS